MNPFVTNIEKDTVNNEYYRKVIFTGKNMQLVLMSVPVGEDIEFEIHPNIDQFIRIETGKGELRTGKNQENISPIGDGTAMIIPAGTYHRVVNTGDKPLKLYTVYAPPNHPPTRIDVNRPQDESHETEPLGPEREYITGNKDTEHLVLDYLSDRDILSLMLTKKNINSRIKTEIDKDEFFERRLRRNYPSLMRFKPGKEQSWKSFYLENMKYIGKIKEEYGLDYPHTGIVFGSPFITYLNLQDREDPFSEDKIREYTIEFLISERKDEELLNKMEKMVDDIKKEGKNPNQIFSKAIDFSVINSNIPLYIKIKDMCKKYTTNTLCKVIFPVIPLLSENIETIDFIFDEYLATHNMQQGREFISKALRYEKIEEDIPKTIFDHIRKKYAKYI